MEKLNLKNPWMVISIILVIILLVVLIKPSGESDRVVNNEPKLPQQSPTVSVSEDDDTFKGDANAPVTIIEFSDYECPFCARFYSNTLPQLEREYIDTGKVKFIYRDFPLTSIHQDAQKAAEATEVARELGGDDAFWKMHNKIFENQNAISVSDLKKYARKLGLPGEEFDNLLVISKYRNEVQKDLQEGLEAGVQGTPTFFINGKKLVGAQPIEAFRQVIDAELA